MKTRLALKVVRNTGAMIVSVYLLLQTFAYLRDNIILGTYDLSQLVPSVVWFMSTAVLAPAIIFCIIIYFLARPIEQVYHRLLAGETLPPEILEKTRIRLIRFSHSVMIINILGFTLGFVLLMLGQGQLAAFLHFDRMVVLLSNIAGGYVYATAQTALNNLLFADLRSRLGIREIGTRKRERTTARRQVVLTVLLVFYALTIVQMNIHDIMTADAIERETMLAMGRQEITLEEAPEHYRSLVLEKFKTFTTRSSLAPEDITIPWERAETISDIQHQVFLLMAVFVMLMIAGIQLAVSWDLRNQIYALIRRLKDVVSGKGDLRIRLDLYSTDDLGELTALINKTLDQFHDVVSRIDSAAGQTRQGATAIAQVLEQAEAISAKTTRAVLSLRDDLESQARESRGLAKNVEQLREAAYAAEQSTELQRSLLGSTAMAMSTMAEGVQTVQKKTDQAGSMSAQLAEKGRQGGMAVQETETAILEIESTARQVLSVLSVLNKIAASTNLLAMNAAIEAAHAGQQGIGFAVVADEVRKLAQTASQQTKNIKTLISAMSERVDTGVRKVASTGQVINELVAGLEDAAGISQDISSIMRDQTSGSMDVTHSLDQVVNSSVTIKSRMDEQSHATQAMAMGLEKVLSRLGELAEESSRQAEVAKALDQAFKEVRAEVDKNLAGVEALTAEFSRFQT